jgi:hypothetical protein
MKRKSNLLPSQEKILRENLRRHGRRPPLNEAERKADLAIDEALRFFWMHSPEKGMVLAAFYFDNDGAIPVNDLVGRVGRQLFRERSVVYSLRASAEEKVINYFYKYGIFTV